MSATITTTEQATTEQAAPTADFKNSWGWGKEVQARQTGTLVVMAPLGYAVPGHTGPDNELPEAHAYVTSNGVVRLSEEGSKAKYFVACVTHRQAGYAETQTAIDLLRRAPASFCTDCAQLVAEGKRYDDPNKPAAPAREPRPQADFQNAWHWGMENVCRKTGTTVVMDLLAQAKKPDHLTEGAALRYQSTSGEVWIVPTEGARYFAACISHAEAGCYTSQLAADEARRGPDRFCVGCATLVRAGAKYAPAGAPEAPAPAPATPKGKGKGKAKAEAPAPITDDDVPVLVPVAEQLAEAGIVIEEANDATPAQAAAIMALGTEPRAERFGVAANQMDGAEGMVQADPAPATDPAPAPEESKEDAKRRKDRERKAASRAAAKNGK